VAGFYSARSETIPPLPWPNFAPPFPGARFSHQASSLGNDLGGPPRLGRTLIAIRSANPSFAAGIETLLSDMAAQPGVRIPGDRRHANRRRNEAEGVTIDADLMSRLREFGGPQ